MIHPATRVFLVCVPLLACSLGHNDCDRSGCEALERPSSPAIAQGIAGAAASPSDVVANGCAECGFAQASLRVMATSEPVVDMASAEAAFTSGAAVATIMVDERYEQALDAGHYLACLEQGDMAYCAGVTVPADEVVTVHVNLPFGPAELVVFEPGQTQAQRPTLYEFYLMR